MRVTFLGTSGAVPTTERNTSAIFVNENGEKLLFDCGEGTQRQMMRFTTGFGVDHLFITHLHGDHVLGIPGLVQTWAFNDREEPLAIHAPAGSRSRIESLVHVGGNDPSFPVRIHQVSAGDVVVDRAEYEVRAVQTEHRCRSVGYALVENDRKGRFDREKAEDELGIPPGPAYSKLHSGESVELDDGRVVHPEEVVGSPRPGRTLVYTGDTMPTQAVVEASDGADLLIHDATFGHDHITRAKETAHSTAAQAADVAKRAGVTQLALTHISTRYGGDPSLLAHEAQAAFDGDSFVARDGQQIDVPYPDEE